ncbi:outer membrane beta-barrel protein [Prosthecomicrobium sp. N25]|uniref:outer membrane beta-barrel protein n=1 Tax=Prosthecomicrobium sp. N25 TaxID=3129254 RepID=UPI003076F9A2
MSIFQTQVCFAALLLATTGPALGQGLPIRGVDPPDWARALPDAVPRPSFVPAGAVTPISGTPAGANRGIRDSAEASSRRLAPRGALVRDGAAVPWLGPNLDAPPLPGDAAAAPPPVDTAPAPTVTGTVRRPTAVLAIARSRGPIPPSRRDALEARPRPFPDAAGPVPAVRPVAPPGPVPAGPPVPPASRTIPEDPLALGEELPADRLGLRGGGFVWLPALELTAGRTDNVEGMAGGRPGPALGIAPELKVRSDWSRHALDVELRGSYTRYPGNADYDRPGFVGIAKARIDLADEMRLDLRGGYTLQRESAGSAETPAGAKVPSDASTWTASAGLTRDVGLIWATLRGDLEATRYTGGTLASGAPIAGAAARDNDRLVLAARTGLSASPAARPYVEGQLTRRTYVMRSASGRDADGYGLRAGLELDSGPLLKGDLSAGWSSEEPADRRLGSLEGWTLDGTLTWSPTRLTRVTVNARTALEPTTLAGSAGSLARSTGLTVLQSVTRQVDAEAGVTLTARRYAGIDRRETTVAGTGTLTWKANPNVHLFLRGTVERTMPGAPDPDYSVGTVLVGLRLQR